MCISGSLEPVIDLPEPETEVQQATTAVDGHIDPDVDFPTIDPPSGGYGGGINGGDVDVDEPGKVTSPLGSLISLQKSTSPPILCELNEETEEIGTVLTCTKSYCEGSACDIVVGCHICLVT